MGANLNPVHDDGVHADQHILADVSAMDDSTMTDVSTGFQNDGDSREHMDGTIFLHIAAIVDDDLPPVSAKDCTGPNVHITTQGNIADDAGLGMDKGGGMNDRDESVK